MVPLKLVIRKQYFDVPVHALSAAVKLNVLIENASKWRLRVMTKTSARHHKRRPLMLLSL